MTQVSRIKLRPDVEKRITNLFNSFWSYFRSKNEIGNFLDDFLSPIEKTILAKRLAIAVLLAKGNGYSEIRQLLKVTPVTISKVSLKMSHGNGSVNAIATKVANSDYGKALMEEFLGIFERKKLMSTGEIYKKPVWERERRITKLKKEI